ncbi:MULTISPECIES: hypothetical protein [unclassified Leptolyngbya]|uniref:hypothetical protein n=1 Tax=unclassified Leptolyngbya TaxID=2650499 RepID=UPI00168463D6|nr:MULTISPECIES: hypothetical protein [unclassified Leptolyngbya]MBD1910895.1 hypothetical protein [Leptolyngbya sp. FACHB-8]MBD2153710.1 hypothetical protein [Leptolyngbya sp. FACHB-16]
MDKDTEIQRLKNLVNGLASELIHVYATLQEGPFKGKNDAFFESKINDLKLLIKNLQDGG